jgi:cytochrome c biogenesis factor
VVLGWGGYWAWDPVENASFLPWFASTALLHSIMVQERRGMLRTWNALLATLTFVLSIFGTYLTRSGIVQSQHAFGDNPVVGNTFLGFLLLTIATCLFLIALRLPAMRSPHRVESLWSREAMFVINNFVLLATASSILILTIWPVISRGVIGKPITVGADVYHDVTIPFFVLLLVITALGPALGWIRTSPGTLRRNLLLPAIAALPVALVIQWGAEAIRAGETGDLDVWKRFYPTFIVIYASCLIVFSLAYEVLRTAANRSRRTGGGFLDSLATLVLRNHRRYGGYIVHVGFAVIAIGIVCSSMYRVERNIQMKVPDPRHRSLPQTDVASLLASPPPGGALLLRGVVDRVDAPAMVSDAARTRIHLRGEAGGGPTVAVDGRLRPGAVSSRQEVYAVGVWDAAQGVFTATQIGHWHPSEFRVGRYDVDLVRAIDEPDRHVYARTALELQVVPESGASFILHPEKRSYPKKEQVVTEVEIHRGLAEDLYVFFQSAGIDPADGQPIYGLTFFRNPLILGVWAGWILMILGGVYAALPMGRKRVGLAD